jgi:hypothetical protein
MKEIFRDSQPSDFDAFLKSVRRRNYARMANITAGLPLSSALQSSRRDKAIALRRHGMSCETSRKRYLENTGMFPGLRRAYVPG